MSESAAGQHEILILVPEASRSSAEQMTFLAFLKPRETHQTSRTLSVSRNGLPILDVCCGYFTRLYESEEEDATQLTAFKCEMKKEF
ncbi:hypothetical protein MPTK1_2g00430 [Marchantia polymorpha subsp. ruderalis]|uniref:Uncharacterized protein n=1 Tax=Marchantia polymorpha TaxID=3197 RepID=A0A2R6X9M3_MARPO|nr:hypothetical protein MARPO_0028s0108 [Marchantia polymorpha]BBN00596.1 hypothetical protein Mp_2g00430 [Marchantia polymorpha subsp. ruderalis]|eukprot:PTQ42801.1 hypothetical protein MARPO_0028s0108 [Marchantia polymorpha]